MSHNKDRESFLEFQETWNLEKVKEMRLDEYTGIGGANREDFTYDIESKFDHLGSFWGGTASKFCIYQYAKNNTKNDPKCNYDDRYAWLRKYGKTSQEAFENVKSRIIETIKYSQANQLHEIDNIKLGHAYKWKIAFHYQNIDDMKIVCIFKQKVLKKNAEGKGLDNNLPTSQIYEKLLGNQTYTLEEMMDKFSRPLWKDYGNNLE